MYWIYVLRSQHKNYRYVGMTANVDKRVLQHQAGKGRSTKMYRPFLLVHSECFPSREAARKREKYLKSGMGREWLDSMYPVAPASGKQA